MVPPINPASVVIVTHRHRAALPRDGVSLLVTIKGQSSVVIEPHLSSEARTEAAHKQGNCVLFDLIGQLKLPGTI